MSVTVPRIPPKRRIHRVSHKPATDLGLLGFWAGLLLSLAVFWGIVVSLGIQVFGGAMKVSIF